MSLATRITSLATAAGQRSKSIEKQRRNADRFGVQYGTGVSAGVVSANTNALQSALNSGERVMLTGPVVIDGTLTIQNTPFDWLGSGYNAGLRQMADVNALVVDMSAGGYCPSLRDLRFEANGNFANSVALTVKGYPNQPAPDHIYGQPMAIIDGITIGGKDIYTTSAGATSGFKKGMRIETPNMMRISNVLIQGKGWNVAGSMGIDMVSSRAAIETVLSNITVYDVETALKAYSISYPGIEGLRILAFTASGVYTGIHLENTVYGSPGWYIGGGTHIAARGKNIRVFGNRQGYVSDCLLYNNGNSISGDYTAFMEFVGAGDWHIQNNKCYYNESGATNDPYGILIGGTATTFGSGGPNYAVNMNVMNNYVVLKNNSDRAAVWYQNYCINSQHGGNSRVGGNKTVKRSNGTVRKIANSTPADTEDYITVADSTMWTYFNPGNTSLGYKLDLTGIDSEYVIVPSELSNPAGSSGTIYLQQIVMRNGQRVTLQFDGTVQVQHDLGAIRLLNNANQVVNTGRSISFVYTGQRAEEISRRI